MAGYLVIISFFYNKNDGKPTIFGGEKTLRHHIKIEKTPQALCQFNETFFFKNKCLGILLHNSF